MRSLVIAFALAVFLGAACSSDTGPISPPQQSVDSTPTRVPTPTPEQSTGGNGSTNTVNESTYDVNCMVSILGRSLTDDIVYGDRGATSEELAKVSDCKLRFDSGKSSQGDLGSRDDQGSGDGQGLGGDQRKCDDQGNCDDQGPGDGQGAVNESTYDVNCMESVLGRNVTDEIAYSGRTATDEELAKISDCKLRLDFGKGSQGDQGSSDGQGLGGDQRKCDDQGNCDDDEVPDGAYECSGSDKDEGGLPITPKCNVVPTPLPAGVEGATLVGVELPNPSYQTSIAECQVFDSGQCAELRWEPVADVMAGEFVEIEISPVDPNVMYAGVDSNDMTMYRSLDAGASWKLVHVTGHNGGLAVSPVDRDIALYTNLEWSVQLTLDGGDTWQSVVGGTAETGGVVPFTAITFSKDQPNIVYATALRQADSRGGIWPAEPADLYKSIDSGRTWGIVGACETCSAVETIVVVEGDPDFLWVAADGGLQFTKDGGRSWSGNVIPYLVEAGQDRRKINEDGPPKVMGLALQPGNPDTMLAASTNNGMFRSTDGGKTWVRSNTGLTSSKLHHVHFAITNPDVAYVTTHEGIFRTDDAGKSWTERSNGLSYKFVTPIAIDPRNEDIVFVGTATEVYTSHPRHKNRGMHRGEGLYKTIDGGKNWIRSDKGIYEAKIAQMGNHPLIPFNIWVGGESGRGNFFSPDAGDTWWFSPSITSHYPMVYAFSYDFPYMIYTTGWQRTGELTASTDQGASWYVLSQKLDEGLSDETKKLGLRLEGPTDFHIHGLAVAPSDSNIVYVGSVHDAVYPDLTFNLDGAHIFKSSDAGESFPEMSNGFPIETRTSINSILVHPKDPDIAYVMTTLHESETAIGIYKTTNGAKSWFAVNDGLDVYTNDVQMDTINPEILYAATESGVYKTIDGAQTWEKSSKGIPKGAVIDMAIDPLNPQVLYAITADDIYRTQDGADHWYQTNLGLPLLESSSNPLSAQEELFGRLKLDRTQTGHSEYGGTFAQDRTLEIDATGTVIFVAVKTSRNDRDRNSERLLYSAVLTPLVSVSYDFSIRNNRGVDDNVKVTSQSNIYDMVFDSNTQELKFVAAGPPGSNSRTTVVLPGSLLSGGDHALACCIKVFLDGKLVPSSSTSEGIIFEHDHVGSSEVVIKTM